MIIANATIIRAKRPVTADQHGQTEAQDVFHVGRRVRYDHRETQRVLSDGNFFQQDGELDIEEPNDLRVGDLVWIKPDDPREPQDQIYRVASADHVHDMLGYGLFSTHALTLNVLAQEGEEDEPA